MDDTTDNFTPGNDQGRVRVAKLFTGDIDNDGSGDIVFTSASFAADKPHLYMIEHSGTLSVEENPSIPNKILSARIIQIHSIQRPGFNITYL